MRYVTARMLSVLVFWCVSLAAATAAPPAHAPVYLVGPASDHDTIALTSAIFSGAQDSLILFESEQSNRYLQAFLADWQPHQIHKVTSPVELWPTLFPRAAKVVVCPPEPRSQLLQAACLAGLLKAPLLIADNQNSKTLRKQLGTWETAEVYAVGEAVSFWKDMGIRTIRLRDEEAVLQANIRHARKEGAIEVLVVANPHDQLNGKISMSTLAPWITLQKRGVLVLTNAAGDNVSTVARRLMHSPPLKGVDALVLVGNPLALPMEKRANPLEGKDEYIEAEPLTPAGSEPVSFATGRIFHDDPAVVALMLARPNLWRQHPEVSNQALIVSNPGGGLPLLETFSRNTALELKNRGFDVHGMFGRKANRAEVRELLPKQTLFLWEGHHSTLVRDYEVPAWREPMWPSLVFLQSCLALEAPKVFPILQRGAVGVLGTSSRTFSASGGALSLAYIDALVYEKQSSGAALRHAKNFLLCFALLKEKRIGASTKFTGANLRTATAFTLWGDPTVQIPLPPVSEDTLLPVTHEIRGHTLIVKLPHDTLPKVVTAGYQTEIRPNASLAGLLTKTTAQNVHPLVPLVFREVQFTKAPADKTPRLHSRLPDDNWVFTYDARRATGYLLIRPRATDTDDVRFTIAWE